MRARSWNTRPPRRQTTEMTRSLAARAERDAAVARGEDRVVAAECRPVAGAEARPALAHDDHPRLDLLAGEDLDAEPLRLGVTPVLRRTQTLLVRHLLVFPSWSSSSRGFAAAGFAPRLRRGSSALDAAAFGRLLLRGRSRAFFAAAARAPASSRRSTGSRSAERRLGSRCGAGTPCAGGACRRSPSCRGRAPSRAP